MPSRTLLRSYCLIVAAATLITSCTTKDKAASKESKSTAPAGTISDTLPSKEIRAVYQDKAGNIWIGTDGQGISRFDGKAFTTYTVKDGISNNNIRHISEDAAGNVWFETADGLTKYDGNSFSALTEKNGLSPKTIYGRSAEAKAGTTWKSVPVVNQQTPLKWFPAYGGVNRYDGTSFTYFPLPEAPNEKAFDPIPPSSILNAYTGYCTLVDREGNLWVGTELRGVFKYDGKTFTWFNDHHLGGAAVRALFQDKHGNIWAGNNGGGLFRYDGNTFINIAEERGLTNKAFLSGEIVKDEPGTIGRIFSLNEDNDGNLWIGTVDAGAWKFDGKTLTNYTTKDGLPSNRICNIYKDNTGPLWFSTVADGICTYNGGTFTAFSGNHRPE